MIVAHLTTVHSRYDTRIFLKECRSLSDFGHKVYLIVADGIGDEIIDNVTVIDVGKSAGRVSRMLSASKRVYHKSIEISAEVYHIHDPELIPIGLALLKSGKKVVFDAHEDLPKQVLSKPYIVRFLRDPVSKAAELVERYACRRLDGIVSATPAIHKKFLKINANCVVVNNYPILGELSQETVDWSLKGPQVCYVGGVSYIRGIVEIVEAMAHCMTEVRLKVGGKMPACIERKLRECAGWNKVDCVGMLDRTGVKDVLQRSIAGLVTFLPAPNHIDAQPNKMFEYMSAGIPVIASNFSLWREIIEKNDCGLCVDPSDSFAIAEAIDYLVSNPETAERMGRNGIAAVSEKYNWHIERIKLIEFYENL